MIIHMEVFQILRPTLEKYMINSILTKNKINKVKITKQK